MEHACYRCGSPVEDQTPFCPSCGAPQIKVSPREPQIAEPAGPASPPPMPETSATAAPVETHPQLAGRIHWKTFFRIAAIPAVINGFALAVPPLGLLVFLASVIMVVWLYRRRSFLPMRTSQGAQMGAALGLMSFLITVVPPTLFCVLDRNECHQALTKALNDAAVKSADPQAQEFLQSLAKSDQGLFGFLALGLVMVLVIMIALGAASGAAAAALGADKPAP